MGLEVLHKAPQRASIFARFGIDQPRLLQIVLAAALVAAVAAVGSVMGFSRALAAFVAGVAFIGLVLLGYQWLLGVMAAIAITPTIAAAFGR